MPDVCAVCRHKPGPVCHGCLADMDQQLQDLPSRFARIPGELQPRQGGPAERGSARVHAALPASEAALSLVGPGADVPTILHPKVRHWSVKRKVLVTTHIVGHARTVAVEVTDWFHELVTDPDGKPVMVPDDDQIGVIPPREWLDLYARRVRAFFGHQVPRRSHHDVSRPYVPAGFYTLLPLPAGPQLIGFLAATHRADGAIQRLAERGLLARRDILADIEQRRDQPPPSIRWDVKYLRTWLDKACAENAFDVATFAAQLRALHAEIGRVLKDSPDTVWVGRCPAFVADLGPDGEPTGRNKPCGAGLWQENDAHLSAQVQCPRCHSTWETRGHAGAGTAREIRRVWPVDRRRRYTAAQADELRRPACPGCNRRVEIQWKEVTGTRDPQRTWQPTGARCPNGCNEARSTV